MRTVYVLLSALLLLLYACTPFRPQGSFQTSVIPEAPKYNKSKNWAALPQQADNADRVPQHSMTNRQNEAEVDVFFLHPTTYTGHKGEKNWNASAFRYKIKIPVPMKAPFCIKPAFLMEQAGCMPLATVRHTYMLNFTADTASAKAAFQLAYSDVKKAF